MKEINYPEHLHLINEPTTRLKKKDFAYLESLHPSTAPNKTSQMKKLFRSKKAMQLEKLKGGAKEGLAESLIERTKDNVFKREAPKEETKVLTKEQFEREQRDDMRRRTETESFKKRRASNKTQFESIKRKRAQRSKPKLSIQTDLEETSFRKAATTKNTDREKNVFLHDSRIIQDEYFDSQRELAEQDGLSPVARDQAKFAGVPSSGPGFPVLPKTNSTQKMERKQSPFFGSLRGSPRSEFSDQEPIFNFKMPRVKIVFQKYAALYNFVFQFNELIEKGEDPYDVVRKYVDFIQDKKFNDLIEIVCNARYRKNINKALLFERWAIFTTFYIYLDRRMTEKSKFIKSFANCVYQNMLLCFMLFKIEIGQLGEGHSR